MKGRKFMEELSNIDPKYIQEAAYAVRETKPAHPIRPKLLLVAAIAAATLLLMGAAAFTRWSSSLQTYYIPSQSAKEQAEQSGLSIRYESAEPEGNDKITASDQGITVTVAQTIVDKSQAQIVLRVDGFTPPEGDTVQPEVWMNPTALDGDFHFHSDRGVHFTKDSDGSLELWLVYHFRDVSGSNLGKEIRIHLTAFGTKTAAENSGAAGEKLVEGDWELRWTLRGSDDVLKTAPEKRLSDNVTLLEAEIGQLSVSALYRTDTCLDGSAAPEPLSPALAGVTLKDGTLIPFQSYDEGYQDPEKLLYRVEYRSYGVGMVDMGQAEALAYCVGWEADASGELTVPVYQYVPIR